MPCGPLKDIVFSKMQQYADTAIPMVEELSAQLKQLDMDALNEAIAGLNTEELSKALENLNDAAETLENFSGSVKDFFSKFGR